VLEWRSDLTRPTLRHGEVLIKVAATGLNYVDQVIRLGYPGIPVKLPHLLGGDIAGRVAELGPGVSGPQVGERVLAYPLVADGSCRLCREGKPNLCLNWQYFGLHRPGGYAELVAVPAANLVPLPDAVTFEQAVALPVAGLTAYHALTTVGQVGPGATVLIWGGGGALGSLAIQIAKQLGAVVIATGSSAAKLEIMQALGADHVIHRKEQDVRSEVAQLAPEGVDVALDYVGPETFPTSFELLRKGGRLLLCGIITGRETVLSIHQTYLRHVSLCGLYLGTLAELRELLAWAAAGRVRPYIGNVLKLEAARQAHELFARGAHVGKIVLSV
jgi:NADPH:quinone reductase-like Zn-dependent oxidoreductase